jgi:hypothetical protein
VPPDASRPSHVAGTRRTSLGIYEAKLHCLLISEWIWPSVNSRKVVRTAQNYHDRGPEDR